MMIPKLAAVLAAITLAGGGAALAQDKAMPAKAPPAPPEWEMIDTNKDGSISRDEWMKAAAARFDRFDVSKDGKLSPEEMRFGMFEEHRHMRGGHGPHDGPGADGPATGASARPRPRPAPRRPTHRAPGVNRRSRPVRTCRGASRAPRPARRLRGLRRR